MHTNPRAAWPTPGQVGDVAPMLLKMTFPSPIGADSGWLNEMPSPTKPVVESPSPTAYQPDSDCPEASGVWVVRLEPFVPFEPFEPLAPFLPFAPFLPAGPV